MTEAKKFATYEDLLKVPDHLVAEIIAGELSTSPRPGPKHTRASSILGGDLTGPFDKGRGGPGGWWILDEPEIHLGMSLFQILLVGERILCQYSPHQNPILKLGLNGFARYFKNPRPETPGILYGKDVSFIKVRLTPA